MKLYDVKNINNNSIYLLIFNNTTNFYPFVILTLISVGLASVFCRQPSPAIWDV